MPDPIKIHDCKTNSTESHDKVACSATVRAFTLVGTEYPLNYRGGPMKPHTRVESDSYAKSENTSTTKPQQITRESLEHLKPTVDISGMRPFDDPAAADRAKHAMPTMAEVREIIARGVKPEAWYDDDEPLF
jgi:hypothetical protein